MLTSSFLGSCSFSLHTYVPKDYGHEQEIPLQGCALWGGLDGKGKILKPFQGVPMFTFYKLSADTGDQFEVF
jgi:hypothetical protein